MTSVYIVVSKENDYIVKYIGDIYHVTITTVHTSDICILLPGEKKSDILTVCKFSSFLFQYWVVLDNTIVRGLIRVAHL